MTLGRDVPNKNLETVRKAFAQFKSTRGVGDPYELLEIGPSHYLSAEDIAALLNVATALLASSLYEGFDVPTLEAMSCGTPVIASDIPVHREVCADAAMYVDAKDVGAWAHAMQELARNPQMREEMKRKGIERAKVYSWDTTAATILQAIREAAK